MKSYGLARLGRDAEVRYTGNGDPVASLSLAFSYGRRGDDGKRPTQWVEGSLWGQRAEALAPHLLRGTLIAVTLEDTHIEEYEGRNGSGHKLVARVTDVEFAGSSQNSQGNQGGNGGGQQRQAQGQQRQGGNGNQQQRQAPQGQQRQANQQRQGAPAGNSGFDDMDDDIPF